ncbi:cation:proton antiporter [Streptomyces sp. LaPpAH-108]|uniref:cation:proton antiporter n=1 Tax=Streptomyces sp. LaPpAH-108 TaxID=1155714 RepID=UPI00035CE13C|nr:cation:proton antiporter [Streptomyces sp. LaPpAH-108]
MGTELAVGLPTLEPTGHLLLALPVMMICCLLAGRVSVRLGQPPVIGEILTGIALGPSLLGAVWPEGQHWLLPADMLPVINALAQLGLVMFMFLVGYELHLGHVRDRGRTAILVSNVSIAVPLLGGVALAFAMYHRFAAKDVGFPAFALFIAVSVSITAFPVLARILTDRGIDRTPVGALALTCAAVDDITAWCLLALVTALAKGGSPLSVLLTAALTLAFICAVWFGLRPLLARAVHRLPSSRGTLPLLLSGLLLAAFTTDWIGIHPIFGAFLFGSVLPRDSAVVAGAVDKMRSLTLVMLLPLFFVQSGLNTEFRLIGADPVLWGWCALITAVAVLTKWAGSAGAAKLTGFGWQDSVSLGALMNCRGLTELVVLGVGLQLGVITPTVFTMLVVMTLVTTMLTAPALTLIDRVSARRTHAAPRTEMVMK